MSIVTPGTPTPPPTPPPAVTIPGFAVTWPKVLTLCVALILAIGGGFWGLISIVYGNIDKNITRVEAKVDDLHTKMLTAAKDAGAFQQMLTEAPELRKNIQETHDAVLEHKIRFDNIDKNVERLIKTTDGVQQSLTEINLRTANIENAIRRIPGMPK
jgi:hypothetical protein